jgi:polyphosphate kinase
MADVILKQEPIDLDVPEKEEINLKDPQWYFNRELSMLQFQRRVLQEACDYDNPLLERVKFLAILGSNLDEFFMVRVAGLKKQITAGVINVPADGKTPAEQLADIRKVAMELMVEARDCFRNELLPLLDKAGIHIHNYDELRPRQRKAVDSYFEEVVFPVLTPMAFDPGHPFPHISNLSLNLAIVVRGDQDRDQFARLKVPASLPRLLPLKRSSGGTRKNGTVPHSHSFVWLEQVIIANLVKLFPGMEVLEAHPFRLTRDADMVIQELEASDLLETMEESVRQRQFGNVVRMSINDDMPSYIREILIDNLKMDRRDLYSLDGQLGLSSLMSLYSIDRYDLKYPPFKPYIAPELRHEPTEEGDIFATIRQGDILVHHPYDSFTPVVDFLKQAARDPNVLAIKQTLYRVGRNSPIVQTLMEARENGKQVAVLVELKARFDEESNIEWARMLEKKGVHVVYGLLGLKTHSKIALVVRNEGNNIRRYMHLATGNYNAVTAQIYEDIGMFTCDDQIGSDATDLFNFLTGYSAKSDYRKLFVAPINLRERMEALIKREIEHQKEGRQGHLIFKMNALVDPPMIRLLYKASQAGVKVDLFIRGICCLRPGIPDVSENIRVISIVGRFLEHSRIYYFRNGGQEQIYLGSADLMPRNINRRVEVLFPVQDMRIIHYLRDEVLATYLKVNQKARCLLPDGTYEYIKPKKGEEIINVQEYFINSHCQTFS